MSNTLARWHPKLLVHSRSPRDLAETMLCFLFPQAWFKLRLAAAKQWHEIEMDFLDLMIDPNKATVDVGANAGTIAYRLSALTPKVYAFEPNPILAAKAARALPPNVEMHAAAVSNKPGVARLSFPVLSGRPISGLASIEPGVLSPSAQTVSIEVPTIRLDDFGFGPVGFIKIDVEGHELSVLEGAAELIAGERPVLLIEAEERHKPGSVASVCSFLETRNFDGFFIFGGAIKGIDELTSEMQDTSKTNKQMRYVNNFIFVPREKSPAFIKGMQDALGKRGSDPGGGSRSASEALAPETPRRN